MKCKIQLHQELSGEQTTIYSVITGNSKYTKLQEFISENFEKYPKEVKNIITQIRVIGKKTCARTDFFKENEGNLGDGVCALYDKNIRLYCIRYGKEMVIIGNGGYKPKEISAFQEDEKLKEENYVLRKISSKITENLNDNIFYSCDYHYFNGNLEFEIDDK